MKKLVIILGLFLMFSCSKTYNDKELEYAISMGFDEGVKFGFNEGMDSCKVLMQDLRDSLLSIKPKSKDRVEYYAIDYNLPTGFVDSFSPSDEFIKENLECEIYIHIKDEDGVIRVFPCTYKAWLTIYEKSWLI